MTSPDSLARFERNLGFLLTTCVLVSATTLAVGLVGFLISPENSLSASLLKAGLFTLMATPVLRVVLSVVEYARMRDWFFVVTTLVVLTQLTITFVLALTRR
jgi:uncharacterized membrane protein